jgi:hypothetical protein
LRSGARSYRHETTTNSEEFVAWTLPDPLNKLPCQTFDVVSSLFSFQKINIL